MDKGTMMTDVEENWKLNLAFRTKLARLETVL